MSRRLLRATRLVLRSAVLVTTGEAVLGRLFDRLADKAAEAPTTLAFEHAAEAALEEGRTELGSDYVLLGILGTEAEGGALRQLRLEHAGLDYTALRRLVAENADNNLGLPQPAECREVRRRTRGARWFTPPGSLPDAAEWEAAQHGHYREVKQLLDRGLKLPPPLSLENLLLQVLCPGTRAAAILALAGLGTNQLRARLIELTQR